MSEPQDTVPLPEPYSALSTPVLKPRFPLSALAYVDAALTLLARRHAHDNKMPEGTPAASHAGLPRQATILAESDSFFGAGWSALEKTRGSSHRWMDRLASLMLRLDLRAGGTLTITGTGLVRGRCLKGASVWIDSHPVAGTFRRKGFRGWRFEGSIPPLDPAAGSACHLLTLQTDYSGRKGDPSAAGRSLAVSLIEIGAA